MAKNKKVERKKLLTLSDLYNFYACQNENLTFSSTEAGYKLAVQVPAQFEVNKEQNDDSLLFCLVKLMHSGENRNHSSVTDDALVKASKGLAYKPILANFVEYTDPDTNETMVDFTSHDMELTENGVVYYEHQIGCFTADEPYFEVEEDTGHNFLYGYCAIPREYTEACSIIERKNGTKISVELEVNEMQYSVKDKVLELTDVTIMGATCLGKNPDTLQNVEEGMKNARLDIVDFSVENNSVINYSNTQDNKLVEVLEKLNTTLSSFSNINSKLKEGGNAVTKFEELLNQYGKTVEDITFDYENLSDEELEAKFAEVFGEDNTDGEGADPEPASEGDEGSDDSVEEGSEPEGDEGDTEPEGEPEGEQFAEKLVRTFEISHEDTRYALYNLLSSFEELDNEWYWISNVYDSYFVYENWEGTKIYRQDYSKDGDNVSFENERTELFKELLTASEKAELEAMRSNYSAISEKLAKYEAEPAKMEVINSEDYAKIAETKEFAELRDNHFDLSVEEVTAKADEILLAYAKGGSINFSAEPEKKTVGMTRLPIQTKNNKKSRYGSLFSK